MNKRHRAWKGGRAYGRSPLRHAPLRKIVEWGVGEYGNKERLECGHEIVQRYDLFGATYPISRRCLKCLEKTRGTKEALR